MAELMYKIANEEAPDVRAIRKDLPPRLAEVVALSLAKRSGLRYQDGDHPASDLRAVIAELPGAAPAGRVSAARRSTPEALRTAYDATQALSASQPKAFEKTLVARPLAASTDTQ